MMMMIKRRAFASCLLLISRVLSAAVVGVVNGFPLPPNQQQQLISPAVGYGSSAKNRNSNHEAYCCRQKETTNQVILKNKSDILSPPSPLRELKCGEQVRAFRRRRVIDKQQDGSSSSSSSNHEFVVKRIALRPPIYLFRQVLCPEECKTLIEAASTIGNMQTAETASGENLASVRKNCQVAWLADDDNAIANNNNLVGQLAVSMGRLVLSPEAFNSPSYHAGYEDMQVVQYKQDGEYVLHHDGNHRIVTVLYYLNGVGETWFPLATVADDVGDSNGKDDNANDSLFQQQHRPFPTTRAEALEQASHLEPGRDGVLLTSRHRESTAGSSTGTTVTVQAGDAVVFYNYHHGEDNMCTTAADWTSIHAGMPVDATADDKWIANHWYHATPAAK